MELLQIKDLLKQNTVLATFLREKDIDFANNGYEVLKDAIEKKGYNQEKFLSEMEEFMNENREERHLTEELVNLPLSELLLHIQMSHHVKERELLFEIDRLLNKSMLLNFEKLGSELINLHNVFSKFKSEIEVHYLIEDKKIFPVLYSANDGGVTTEEAMNGLKKLEEDHKGVGEYVSKMIQLTSNFKPPQEGDMTVARTYELIAELIDSVLIHMYLENYTLMEALEKQTAR